jgi:hypothetical protein
MKSRPLKNAYCPRARYRANFVESLAKYLDGEKVPVQSLAAAGERFQRQCLTGKFTAVRKARATLPALRELAGARRDNNQKDRDLVRKSWLRELSRFAPPAPKGKSERTRKPKPSGPVTLGMKSESDDRPTGCLALIIAAVMSMLLGSCRLL